MGVRDFVVSAQAARISSCVNAHSTSHFSTSLSSSGVAARRRPSCFATAEAARRTPSSADIARSTSSAVRTPRSDHCWASLSSWVKTRSGSGFRARDFFSCASTIFSTASCVNPSRFSQSFAISYCFGCSRQSGPNSDCRLALKSRYS